MNHRISIVYHSESGRTKQLAQEVFNGVNEYKNIECKVISISDCDYNFIEQSQAVIFGSPTYYGGMSWQMKRFIDGLRDYVNLEGKIGSAFCSGKSLRVVLKQLYLEFTNHCLFMVC
ncbi:MAG: flavodoxin family protein [Nanoarchaeota archaeon]|nr:flavodoxin family protein [Nanoarchaeota archaeon]